MRVALVVLVAVIGVISTIVIAVRLWRASRRGAPRELQLGYLALMVLISVVTSLLLRAL
jgi:hypothetical protein